MTCEEIICIILATAGSIIAIMAIYFGIKFVFNAALNDKEETEVYQYKIKKLSDEKEFYRDRMKSLQVYNQWLQKELDKKENESNRS